MTACGLRGKRVAWVDIHTGLGNYGDYVMLAALGAEEVGARRGRSWYSDAVQIVSDGDAVTPTCNGSVDLGLFGEFAAECSPTTGSSSMVMPIRSRGRRSSGSFSKRSVPPTRPGSARILAGGARVLQQARDGLAAARKFDRWHDSRPCPESEPNKRLPFPARQLYEGTETWLIKIKLPPDDTTSCNLPDPDAASMTLPTADAIRLDHELPEPHMLRAARVQRALVAGNAEARDWMLAEMTRRYPNLR